MMANAALEQSRMTAILVFVLGIALAMNLGIRFGISDALRPADLVAGGMALCWLMFGGRAFLSGWCFLACVAAVGIVILGSLGASSPADRVFCVRVAEVALLVVFGKWLASRQMERQFVAGLLVGALGSALIIIWESHLAGSGGWWAVHDFDLTLSKFIVKESPGFVFQAGSLIRPSGPFDHPNGAAGILAVCLALAAGLATHRGGRPMMRWLTVGVAIAIAYALLVTTSRGGALVGVIVATIAFLTRPGGRTGRVGTKLVGVLLLIVAASVPIVLLKGTDYASRLGTTAAIQDQATFDGRLTTWSGALKMVGDSPIEGNGRDRVRQKLQATHNAFLFTAAAMGLPMGILVLGFSLRGAWIAFSRLRRVPNTPSRAALFGVLAVTMLCWLEDRVVDAAFLGIAAVLIGIAIHGGQTSRVVSIDNNRST